MDETITNQLINLNPKNLGLVSAFKMDTIKQFFKAKAIASTFTFTLYYENKLRLERERIQIFSPQFLISREQNIISKLFR